MRWSILILHQPCRVKFLERLMNVLAPQVVKFPDVEIVVQECSRLEDTGKVRQRMVEDAAGEYISFVDDDDCVPSDYIERIHALLDGVDYIGFEVSVYNEGKPYPRDFHSLQYPQWYSDNSGQTYRDLSHVNPIKKSLAMQAKFTGCVNEDARWANELRDLHIVKTEHYIDKPMYFYYIRSVKNDHDGPGKYGVNS